MEWYHFLAYFMYPFKPYSAKKQNQQTFKTVLPKCIISKTKEEINKKAEEALNLDLFVYFHFCYLSIICNSYTMVCPPVR